jgi:threonine/homoserine/homoserine lactone efflux protein
MKMDYWLFLLICLVATFSPGPAVLLAIKNFANFGVWQSMKGIAGNVAAVMTLASLSAAGLGAIILASDLLFSLIKVLGGLYLMYLGVKAWNTRYTKPALQKDSKPLTTGKKLFTEAYVVGMSNPKAIAFYTAVFPQFIDLNQAVLPQFCLLAGTFACCSMVGLGLYALATTSISQYLARENINRLFHRLTGGIFIGFGLSLIFVNKS